MGGNVFDGHDFAEFVDVSGEALGYPQVRVKKFQVFDDDSLAVETKDLAILALEPDLGRGQVEISYGSLGPAVDVGALLAAEMADGVKTFVGNDIHPGLGRIRKSELADETDAGKGEIGCYTEIGHRRPPGEFFLAAKQDYNPFEIPDVHFCLIS
jgi:hypothetical protein